MRARFQALAKWLSTLRKISILDLRKITGRRGKGGAIGWVARDNKGNICASGSKIYRGMLEVESLEAPGIR
ncbi:hypothetical protein LINGRAHAP2_LOCUS2421, partial [Linum grandiflorum]